jgi:HPt (histidine-containing phosphotransfer) domain-containing protein
MSQLHDADVVNNLKGLIGEDKFSVILSSSRQSLEGIIDELKSAHQSNDLETMRRAAHSIKSSVGNYGAISISEKAQVMEHQYKDGILDTAAEDIEELATMVQNVLIELEAYLQ